MKLKAQVYEPPANSNLPKLPTSLANLREFAIPLAAQVMRVFGIGKLSSKPVSVGIRTMADVSFKPLPDQPPADLLSARNTMARLMGDFVSIFGVTEIDMEINNEDMQAIKQTWTALSQPKPTGAKPSTSGGVASIPSVQEIPLNIEQDPTGKSVLETATDANAK